MKAGWWCLSIYRESGLRERESTPYGVVVVRICRLKIAAGQAEDQPPDDRGYPTRAQSLSASRGTRDCVTYYERQDIMVPG